MIIRVLFGDAEFHGFIQKYIPELRANDLTLALGAMRALREAGRRVPEDCSVIAIDGLTMSEYFYPMLTTLCQPMEEMGRRSVEILMDMIHGRGRPRCETVRTVLRRGASVRRIN